ncbi:MAG: serine/threonine protein kinase, partial [Planctomycetes bacterium]|nr:serine/threonine protein kinase [Planctomycetota bacterium]
RLGQELIKRRLATVTQVRKGIQAREDLRRSGTNATLGNLLVSRGVLTLQELMVALATIGELHMSCPACRVTTKVDKYDPDERMSCEHCSGELVYVSSPLGEKPAPSPRRRMGTDDSPTLEGRVIGGCRIVKRIAAGGMGTVYEAEQINLGRTVALKVLAADLSRDETFVKRFLLEARAAAELNHRNIIHINDAGEDSGIFYYTMEYVPGENLAQRLKRERTLSVDDALRIGEQVAEALLHAHERKIIHRDIKPENIMIKPDGTVKLADLGLAKKTVLDDTAASSITQAGSVLGTPHYMAPEQARDFRFADHRSDLYSLGVTLYRALAGQVPFDGGSPIEVMMKAVEGEKTSLRELREDIPQEVEALVDRLMAVDPDRRFRDARVFLNAVASLRRHHVVQ